MNPPPKFGEQLSIPGALLPPPIRARLEKLHAAGCMIAREARKAKSELYAANLRFPHALDAELSHLELSLDHLGQLLSPTFATYAENPTGRDNSLGAAAQTSTQDGQQKATE